jgi:hypothetical protein
METTLTQLSTIDKTLFQLEEITEYEELPYLHNMIDLMIEDDETFCLSDGTISHNSAVSGFLAARNPVSDGSYALRGKILNTNGIKKEEIAHNKELADLMGIIGLDLYSNSINEDPQHLYEISIDNQNFIVSIDDEILLNNKKYLAKDFIDN